METYFVGLFVNPVAKAATRPILLRKIGTGLTLEEAEAITTARNLAAGHRCDDIELKLTHPEARFYMYDSD